MAYRPREKALSLFNPLRDFKRFFLTAQKGQYKYFTIYHWRSSELSIRDVEFACVASRKAVSKRATQRNRAKRRIKTAVYGFLAKNSVDCKIKLFIAAKKTAVTASWESLLCDLNKAMARILEINEN